MALLDEAFAGIDEAKSKAEANAGNILAIFEAKLHQIFVNPGPEWKENALDELGIITSSKRIFKSEYVAEGVPFYRTKEIKQLANGREITTELFISDSRYCEIEKDYGVPIQGDILLTAIGTIGEIWVVEGKEKFYFKDGNVLWLKHFTSIKPQFLRFALISFVESLNKLAHGSTYSALPIQRLKEHRISLPSLEEQVEIVKMLESLNCDVRRIAYVQERKLTNLNELKSSILSQAFAGELTV